MKTQYKLIGIVILLGFAFVFTYLAFKSYQQANDPYRINKTYPSSKQQYVEGSSPDFNEVVCTSTPLGLLPEGADANFSYNSSAVNVMDVSISGWSAVKASFSYKTKQTIADTDMKLDSSIVLRDQKSGSFYFNIGNMDAWYKISDQDKSDFLNDINRSLVSVLGADLSISSLYFDCRSQVNGIYQGQSWKAYTVHSISSGDKLYFDWQRPN